MAARFPSSLLFLTCAYMGVTSVAAGDKLLLVLLDGFRWDYVDKVNLPNFKMLQNIGARAGYVENDFATLSYPNYYTLMTGLHTESHGMTGNFMYDRTRDEWFLIGTNPEQYHAHWWEGGEPLWVSAERQGKRAYMFQWPGCEVEIRGINPRYCQPYESPPPITVATLNAQLNTALAVLTNGSADVAGVYHEQPDYYGHRYGPDSVELAETLRGIDTELGKLLEKIEQLEGENQVNLMIFSDHGMTEIDTSRVINISTALTPDLYTHIVDKGSVVTIFVEDKDKEDEVYSLLSGLHPNMTVYRREEIPARYHYRHGKYVGDITCVADLGWFIMQPEHPEFLNSNGVNYKAHHGFDNLYPDMRGIFYAFGPYFKQGSRVPNIRAVDLYNVMCDILDIKAAPNNGTRNVLRPILATSGGSDVTSLGRMSMLFLFLVVVNLWVYC